MKSLKPYSDIPFQVDINMVNKNPSTKSKFQFQCLICQFKCQYMKSFKMHMLNKHSKIEGSDDSTEVTSANNDATPPCQTLLSTLPQTLPPTLPSTLPPLRNKLQSVTTSKEEPVILENVAGKDMYPLNQTSSNAQ